MTIIRFECPVCEEPTQGPQDQMMQLPYDNDYDSTMAGEYVCDECYEKYSDQ